MHPKIEQIIRKQAIEKALSNSRRYDIFHPSAWGYCLRKIAYQYYNEEEHFLVPSAADVDQRMQRIFDNGHSMHARWQEYMTDAGILRGVWQCKSCEATHGDDEKIGVLHPSRTGHKCACGNFAEFRYKELLVKSDVRYNFEGHVDAVVDLRGTEFERRDESDVFIADMKSMKSDMFEELTEAKPEHVVQVNIYMWLLDLQAAVLVYENKDTQAVKEMFVPRDNALIEQIKSQAEWLKGVLAYKKLPNRPAGFTLSKFPCRLCEFSSICFA